jgi:hypothetical protein
MAMKKSVIMICILFVTVAIANCSKDSNNNHNDNALNPDCSTITNKAFTADVNPIVQAVCNNAGCHVTGSTNGPGALTNYTQVFNARANIRTAISLGSMPQGTTLSVAQRSSILCWIDGGAPNN